ncbi:MAG: DapH/DapD/GlmU-related protein [Actinomycetota bacterium]
MVPQEVVPIDLVTRRRLVALLYRHPPLRAMAWFRFGSALQHLGVPAIPGWVQRRLLRLYGLELSVGASIGGGMYIAHPVGCVLAADEIGEDVTVIAQVTFGTRDDDRWPMLGDRSFFGAGARVLGGIEIGDGARVGANSVVLDDVEAGATVVGAPARRVGGVR